MQDPAGIGRDLDPRVYLRRLLARYCRALRPKPEGGLHTSLRAGACSYTVTAWPACLSAIAFERPATPAPMMATATLTLLRRVGASPSAVPGGPAPVPLLDAPKLRARGTSYSGIGKLRSLRMKLY